MFLKNPLKVPDPLQVRIVFHLGGGEFHLSTAPPRPTWSGSWLSEQTPWAGSGLSSSGERVWRESGGISLCALMERDIRALTGSKLPPSGGNMARTFCPETPVTWIAEFPCKGSLPLWLARNSWGRGRGRLISMAQCTLRFVKLIQVTRSVLEGRGVSWFHLQWFQTHRFGWFNQWVMYEGKKAEWNHWCLLLYRAAEIKGIFLNTLLKQRWLRTILVPEAGAQDCCGMDVVSCYVLLQWLVSFTPILGIAKGSFC